MVGNLVNKSDLCSMKSVESVFDHLRYDDDEDQHTVADSPHRVGGETDVTTGQTIPQKRPGQLRFLFSIKNPVILYS